MTWNRFKLIAAFAIALTSISQASAEVLKLDKGEHICLVGNALGEGMQHQNFWETMLHNRFPEKNLVVRNLCFPGDEPQERIRSLNFGDPHKHLTHSKASTVIYYFGFNESFDDSEGLQKFKDDIKAVIDETKTKKYDGKSAPKMVFVSPIAFEKSNDPNLPNGETHNTRLKAYSDALQEVCKANGVGFVDVFTPTKSLFEKSKEQLTLNCIHLNEKGYKHFAPILMDGLFGNGKNQISESVHNEVEDKNFHWWHRYRAVNGYSIYGSRGKAGKDGSGLYNNTDVMEREREILDQMTANRDQRIWAAAQGKTLAEKVDDSNTLPFINPKTNVGGENDVNRKRGKLGSLDYLNAEKQQKLFKLAPGYEINLVASEEEFPELANPVALNFDNKGRLWVATMASYPHWKPKTKMDDKILIFEDHNKDGKADECKVFAGGLHQPTGFEIGKGGAYIANQPDILYMKDTDGDDKADVVIRKLFGLDTADSHHGISAFEWGPGGGLYFEEGTFKYSQVETINGVQRLQEGGIWRYDPVTEDFHVHVSLTFSNPWGHCFDRWGQNFIGDASPGNGYWATPISGRIDYPQKHAGGGHNRRIHKFSPEIGGDPNYKYPTFYKKRIRPLAGCAIVSSGNFPEDTQGNFLVTNCIGERTVLSHKVEEKGSGFVGTEVPAIVSCEDGNFRPVDIQFAPDGSLYIVDWHNALIGHLQHNLRDPSRDHSHGRIWRVTYKNRPLDKPAKIEGESIPHLLDLLKLKQDRTRYRAKRELAERDGEKVATALQKWVSELDASGKDYEHHLLEALWMHQTHNKVNVELLKKLLSAKDHRARAAATRVLAFWHDKIANSLELVKKQIGDSHPRVRIEALRATSFYDDKEAAIEVALEILEHEDEDKPDTYIQYMLNETLRQLES